MAGLAADLRSTLLLDSGYLTRILNKFEEDDLVRRAPSEKDPSAVGSSSGNADHNAARNILHLYRMGHALIPAAGRAVVRRAKRVKPATAR